MPLLASLLLLLLLLLLLRCSRFEPYGVSDLVTSVPRMCKTPKWIFTYSNGVVCCVKNRNPIALIFERYIVLNFM